MVMSQPSITKALAMAIGGKDPLEKVILQTSPLAQGIEAPINKGEYYQHRYTRPPIHKQDIISHITPLQTESIALQPGWNLELGDTERLLEYASCPEIQYEYNYANDFWGNLKFPD